MPESGESSRKLPRKGGFSVFQRLFQGNASRSRRVPPRSPAPTPGDLCQIGDGTGTEGNQLNRQSGFGRLNWLLGKRQSETNGLSSTPSHRRRKSSSNLHLETNQPERRSNPRSSSGIRQTGIGLGQVETGRSGIGALNRQTSSPVDPVQTGTGRASNRRNSGQTTALLNSERTGIGREGDRRRSRQSRSQQNRSQQSVRPINPTKSTPLASSEQKPSSIVPAAFSRKRERGETARNGRNSKTVNTALQTGQATHLQTQPTGLQQQTALQQKTTLQDLEHASNKGRAVRRRKREPDVPARPRSRSMAIALYAARMLILSVGVGVLAGTVLSAWNPANNPFLADASQQTIKQASSAPFKPAVNATGQLQLTQEIAPLKSSIQQLMTQYTGMTSGVFLVDLDTNNYVDLSGGDNFSAASMIKLPILVAFFQDVDAGRIRLDEKLTLRKEMIGSGSGELQGYPPGSQFTALDVVTKMITLSDNTATNMIIAKLGGVASVNQRLKSWGMTTTSLNSVLPDLQGTNITSPKEMTTILVRLSQGDLVSLKSRDRLLDIMRRTINNSQLPPGLGEGAMIAHKTGDIGKLIGDVGLVDMPNGKRYAIAVMVKCPFNDSRAYELVQKISRSTYQNLNGGTMAAPTSASSSPPAEESGADANTPEHSGTTN